MPRAAKGNAERYTCFYHGWTYDRDGNLVRRAGRSRAIRRASIGKRAGALQKPPRVDATAASCSSNFDPDAMPLDEYLAGAKEYIDLVVDQSPSGAMEVIQGTQEYDIRANWKLLVENSFDDYHLMTTHSTWLDYLKKSGVEMKQPGEGHSCRRTASARPSATATP